MSQEHPLLECGSCVLISTADRNTAYIGRVEYTGHRLFVLSEAVIVDLAEYVVAGDGDPAWEEVLHGELRDSAIFLPPPGNIAINLDHIGDIVRWPHDLPREKSDTPDEEEAS